MEEFAKHSMMSKLAQDTITDNVIMWARGSKAYCREVKETSTRNLVDS